MQCIRSPSQKSLPLLERGSLVPPALLPEPPIVRQPRLGHHVEVAEDVRGRPREQLPGTYVVTQDGRRPDAAGGVGAEALHARPTPRARARSRRRPCGRTRRRWHARRPTAVSCRSGAAFRRNVVALTNRTRGPSAGRRETGGRRSPRRSRQRSPTPACRRGSRTSGSC